MRPSLVIALAVLCLALAPPLAVAEPQNGGAAISIVPSGVRVPFCVVAEPDSGALVLLEDTRNANIDVYAQRLDRHGRRTLGAGGTLIWSSPVGAQLTSYSPDGSGGVLFAWTQNNGASGSDIYVQRVQANGTIVYAAAGLVVCNATGDQSYPYLATGLGGTYWVAWTDQRAGVLNEGDVYVQRLNLAGVAQLAAGGIPVNALAYRTSSYGNANIAADLAGGLLLSWSVYSPGGVRAQRVGPTGTLLFGVNGAALADPSDYSVSLAADGSGGLWGWTSRWNGSAYIPYAHHLSSTGVSSFAPAGIAFLSANAAGFDIHGVRDGSGGCFFYGIRYYNPAPNGSATFRQHVDTAGNLLEGTYGDNFGYNIGMMTLFDTGTGVATVVQEYPGTLGWENRVQQWSYAGVGVYTGTGVVVGRAAPNYGQALFATAGGTGGLVVEAQADPRYNTVSNQYNYQSFGQALDANGNALWDDAENPVLVSAKDAPSDQGGDVRLAWSASVADDPAARVAVGYRGWRSLELTAAASLAARHAGVTGAFEDGGKRYLALAGQFWEQVAEEPAAQLPGYALTLPTGQDSTGAGHADESFMIEAYDDSLHHWYSSALTAHSVDNLPPTVPAPFTGNYVAGTTYLLWNANHEADLAGYRLYRGGSAGFVPGPANLVATLTSPGYDDAAGFPAVYKLSAIDTHGNESGYAVLVPGGETGVDRGVPAALAFTLGSRNPAHGGATVRLALPASERVRVAIYDAGGREVCALTDGELAAGSYALAWNGSDAGGRALASGLYFARLVTPERTLTLRLALTR